MTTIQLRFNSDSRGQSLMQQMRTLLKPYYIDMTIDKYEELYNDYLGVYEIKMEFDNQQSFNKIVDILANYKENDE